MISTFADIATTVYTTNQEGGLIYSDLDYSSDSAISARRQRGILAGQPLSALLVNTALKQYCNMSYVICQSFLNVLNRSDVESTDNTDVGYLSSDAIAYLYNLKRIMWPLLDGTDRTYPTGNANNLRYVHTVINYDTTSTHKDRLFTASSGGSQIGIKISAAINTLKTNFQTLQNKIFNDTDSNAKFSTIYADPGYIPGQNAQTIAQRIQTIQNNLTILTKNRS